MFRNLFKIKISAVNMLEKISCPALFAVSFGEKIHYAFNNNQMYFQANKVNLEENEKHVLTMLKQGNVLAKIFAHYDEYNNDNISCFNNIVTLVSQLQDRNNFSKKTSFGSEIFSKDSLCYKYNHMKDVIEIRQTNLKKNESQTHTKKLSTSLISSNLGTPLAESYHFTFVVGIGALFDLKHSVVKAMFDIDAASWCREWISHDRYKVERYAAQIKPHSFTNIEEFKNKVNSGEIKKNEVLAKLNLEGLIGIVIHCSIERGVSNITCMKAQEFRDYIFEKLGKNVPIVFYDSAKKIIQIYSKEDQAFDQLQHQMQEILNSRNDMVEIKDFSISTMEIKEWLHKLKKVETNAVFSKLLSAGPLYLNNNLYYNHSLKTYSFYDKLKEKKKPKPGFRFFNIAEVKKLEKELIEKKTEPQKEKNIYSQKSLIRPFLTKVRSVEMEMGTVVSPKKDDGLSSMESNLEMSSFKP